jgi:hypothetical protein
MHPATLLTIINEQHRTTFTLINRFAHGESGVGAYAVIDDKGRRGVLKWSPQPDCVERLRAIGAATARLRTRGYPAPLYLIIGSLPTACYAIQEMLPGTPLQVVPVELLPHLVQLNVLQRGQAMIGQHDWPRPIIDTVLYGGDGFCLLEPLQTYSTVTAELLVTLQALVAQHQDEHYETGDLVHIDFNPTNILVNNGKVSGVIDWHDPHAGDCTFDLVTLLVYGWDSPIVREYLWQHVVERVGLGVLSVYLAHMLLRQVDWSIRHHGAHAVTMWLRIAQESLARCRVVGHK